MADCTYLAPPLSVPDLGLVLEMSNHLRFSGQSPDQSSSVGRGILFGWAQSDGGFVHVSSRFIDGFDQQFHEPVDLAIVIVVVADFKRVIEEDMG
jgi:hypothetical protein